MKKEKRRFSLGMCWRTHSRSVSWHYVYIFSKICLPYLLAPSNDIKLTSCGKWRYAFLNHLCYCRHRVRMNNLLKLTRHLLIERAFAVYGEIITKQCHCPNLLLIISFEEIAHWVCKKIFVDATRPN